VSPALRLRLCPAHLVDRAAYVRRKQTVEPAFGQIKGARGFRQFLLRGLEAVTAEWRLICLGHNLLKLHRSAAAGRVA
jgi:hypothetical protein